MSAVQQQSLDAFAILCSRLQDFFARRTPWHRRLWSIGTVLSLQEVLEYTDGCLANQVRDTRGLQFVVETAQREVARDPGVKHIRSEIDLALNNLKKESSSRIKRSDRDELEQLTRRAKQDYCHRWKNAPQNIPIEFAARALATHLLDAGFSPDHLYRWLQATQESMVSIEESAEELASMTERMPVKFHEVFVPCSAPGLKPQSSVVMRWVDGRESALWLRDRVPGGGSHRHSAGLLVKVQARDPWAAVEGARTLIARADARAKVAQPSNKSIELAGWARVAGSNHTFRVDNPGRRVEIGSLAREAAVYDFDGGLPAETDDALELASSMESPSPGTAITGGWAAIEGMLIRPGEGSYYEAADRLAALVACSFPRAEMTPLAYRHIEASDDDLAHQIREATTNKQKVLLVERHLSSGGLLTLTDNSDIAAQNRMLALVENKAQGLERIRRYVTESLRRLYNQRNVIAHSGSLRSVTLEATLRTSPILVGAGLDRIVHAQLQVGHQLTPLSLVARAETELRMVGTPGGRELASLLD